MRSPPTLLSGVRPETVDRFAKRLQVKEDRVKAWEAGERQPTLRQIQALARFFHRPLSVFFMPRPPQLPSLAAEYRRLPDVEPGHESPELRLALRQMLTRRENALNLMGELGQVIPEFGLRAHLPESPVAVGQRVRLALGVSVEARLGWANEWEAWRHWRAAAERLGVLVFQFTKVPLNEGRGLALPRIPTPVAAVNGRELPQAKAFTLCRSARAETGRVGQRSSAAGRETVSIDAACDGDPTA